MEKLAIFTIGDGNFEQGFDRATLEIYERGEITQSPSHKFSVRLPPSEMPIFYKKWQEQYENLPRIRGFKSGPTHLSISEDTQQLRTHLHRWLEPITQQVSQSLQLTPPDEIRLIVQTHEVTDEETQKTLHQLPWHEWKFTQGCPTEAAISFAPLNSENWGQFRQKPPNEEEIAEKGRIRRVKILGILGDSKGIDLEADRQIIQELRAKGGSYSFLDDPKRSDLANLWDKRWDIICFSGHSESTDKARTGLLFINSQESLDIAELRNALTTARNQGLKLVIFNSCNGLGLAKAIADLNIPYVIVWREQVPDLVAQRFLYYLLQSFAVGKSLHQSMREAREKLQLEGFETQCPGVTGLPLICQNLAVGSVTWEGLRGSTGGTVSGADWGAATQPSRQDYKFRQTLLKKVRNYWIKGVLENSLHNQILIQLGLERRMDAIDHPWRMAWETPDSLEQPYLLPVGTRIIDQFDELGEGRTLLILGEPGSGKTITLLELARDLIADAEEDETLPMPVVFNLSTWGSEKRVKTFVDWLVEELKRGYQVSKALAKKWIDNQQLLLLLDGLDEVKVEKRESCLNAINQFSQEYGNTEIVVCCRIKNYNNLSNKLKFQGAIYLQALTQKQIERYLNQAGKDLTAVRRLLQEDEAMQELSTTPLMLNIMSLAYRGMSVEELPRMPSIEARRKHLFDAYIKRMFERRGGKRRYLFTQSLRWLSWLAQRMVQESQTVFLIERMQPSWLQLTSQKYLTKYYIYIGIIYGVIFSISFLLLETINDQNISLKNWLLSILLVPISGVFLATFMGEKVRPAEIYVLNPLKEIFKRYIIPFIKFMPYLLIESTKDIISTITNLPIKISFLLAQRVKLTLGNKWFYATVVFLCIFLAIIRAVSQPNDLLFNFLLGLIEGIVYGSIFVFFITVIFVPIIEFIIRIMLFVGPGVFLGSLVLIGILSHSLVESEEIEVKKIPNQGIWKGSINAVLISLISGLLGAIIAMSANIILLIISFIPALLKIPFLFSWKNSIWQYLPESIVSSLFYFGIIGAAIGGLISGSACIQHFILRLILYRNGYIPWNYARFLDYVSERILLQRVGGGYIFIHRLLMEHFAGMEI